LSLLGKGKKDDSGKLIPLDVKPATGCCSAILRQTVKVKATNFS